MSISFSNFSIYLDKFVDKTHRLNNIILSIRSKKIIHQLFVSTKNNLYKNSLRIAIESFEKNDNSYLNSLEPQEIYIAYQLFANKLNINICEKVEVFNNSILEQYGIYDYIELLINTPHLPMKIQNELQQLTNGESSLCLYCGSNMKLQDINQCYDENSDLYCDFTRNPIKSGQIAHCLGGKNIQHCNGFDIGLESSSTYFNDLMDKRLERRIMSDLQNNKYNKDETELRFIYSVICSNMIPQTIVYYNSIYNDLVYLNQSPNNTLDIIKTHDAMSFHLDNMKRILIAGNNNWKLECEKLIDNTTNNINSFLQHFKNTTLSLDYNVYFTQLEKEMSIKNHRNQFSDILSTIKNKMECIRNYNNVLENLENISFSRNISKIFTTIDKEVYQIYELIEILEKSTPIEKTIPINIVSNYNKNDTCCICLDNLDNTILTITHLLNLSGIFQIDLYIDKLNSKEITHRLLMDLYTNDYQQFINLLNDIDINQTDLDKLLCYLKNNDYPKPVEIFKISNCNHLFHKSCLNKWLQINNSCPICRTNSQ